MYFIFPLRQPDPSTTSDDITVLLLSLLGIKPAVFLPLAFCGHVPGLSAVSPAYYQTSAKLLVYINGGFVEELLIY